MTVTASYGCYKIIGDNAYVKCLLAQSLTHVMAQDMSASTVNNNK